MDLIDRIVNGLRSWSRFTRALEGLLIDNIAATIPWLAPLVPASMVYTGMINTLMFPMWAGIVAAVVVEFLGMSAVVTTFQFWDYNDTRRKVDARAPVQFAVLTTVFYLAIVLTVNVVLDTSPAMQRLAKALLSCLSVVGAVILAMRSQHSRRLMAVEDEKQARKIERLELRKLTLEAQAEAARLPEPAGNLPLISNDWKHLPEEDKAMVRNLPTSEIVRRYGVSERTARNWRAYGNNGHNGARPDEDDDYPANVS